jgi:hypothetical protein
VSTTARPAFYALAPAAGATTRPSFTPYTLWHLSYVAIGAALAPEWHPARLLAALAAFFLAVGIGAHAPTLNGRPLGTGIPNRVLAALAALGRRRGRDRDRRRDRIRPLAARLRRRGRVAVYVYNLELLGGWFHNDVTFALAGRASRS